LNELYIGGGITAFLGLIAVIYGFQSSRISKIENKVDTIGDLKSEIAVLSNEQKNLSIQIQNILKLYQNKKWNQ